MATMKRLPSRIVKFVGRRTAENTFGNSVSKNISDSQRHRCSGLPNRHHVNRPRVDIDFAVVNFEQ
jgi:hypothetical protein